MIKKQALFSIFFFFFATICYGQNYSFDKMINSTFSTEFFPNQTKINLFNTQDDSYFMKIHSKNDSLIASIYDTTKCQIFLFTIDKSDFSKFTFFKTKNLSQKVQDYIFEFSEIESKNGKNTVIFKIRNNRKTKISKYKLTIKETDQNLFWIFKLSSIETLLFTKIIPPPHLNFIVLEAKGTNTSGNYVAYKINSIDDITLNIEMPDKIN